ncbi:MAG TPA: efflux RND transporter periplasmic adaptor subunit [Steroidobacteraceae bacterium]|nr:efflux RND transporter periplasmic adaptor subunit [Steroidobacteraceae bacterium]
MDRKSALLEELRADRTPSSVRPRATRHWWLIGGGVIAAAAGFWLWAGAGDGVTVQTAVAKAIGSSAAGGVPAPASLLDASGYVVALRQANVSAKSIYKIDEVLVQEGQQVKRGEVIARLDDTNVRAALEQSKAQVRQSEAALAAAKLAALDARPTFLRDQAQLAEGLISPETFDAAKVNYDAAQTAASVAEQNLAVARATVDINQRFEDDTVIKAPFDGVVTVKNAQPGELVSPQFSGGGGIAKIVDMDSLEVDVDVSENFITRVHPKQGAVITLNAYPGWQIPAEVIAVIPTADRAKATVKVRIGFKQNDSRIVPEMGARVSFLDEAARPLAGGSPAGGVIVPTDAVQVNGDTGIVFLVSGNLAQRREVRLGARTADGQTILSGVLPGAILAIGDFAKLNDGTKIRVSR